MKNIKTAEEISEELFDKYSWYVDDNLSSMEMVSGRNVVFQNDFKSACLEIANQLKPEWVSVEDKEPEIDQMVIGYRPLAHTYGDETITMLKFKGYENEDANGVIHKFERCHHVTHWMPLPELPQPPQK